MRLALPRPGLASGLGRAEDFAAEAVNLPELRRLGVGGGEPHRRRRR